MATDVAGNDALTDGDPGSADDADAPEPRSGRLRGWLHFTLPGCWGAVLFAALSFTPSLLPRGGFIQGLVCGITASIGYGLGVLGAWLWRAFADREPRAPKPSSWRALLIGGGVLLVVALRPRPVLAARDPEPHGGDGVQHRPRRPVALRRRVLLRRCSSLIGRGIRRVYHWVADLLSRRFGRRAAARRAGSSCPTTDLPRHQRHPARRSRERHGRGLLGRGTPSRRRAWSSPRPASGSGGPGSMVSWDSLGREGRTFTGVGPHGE